MPFSSFKPVGVKSLSTYEIGLLRMQRVSFGTRVSRLPTCNHTITSTSLHRSSCTQQDRSPAADTNGVQPYIFLGGHASAHDASRVILPKCGCLRVASPIPYARAQREESKGGSVRLWIDRWWRSHKTNLESRKVAENGKSHRLEAQPLATCQLAAENSRKRACVGDTFDRGLSFGSGRIYHHMAFSVHRSIRLSEEIS